MVVAAFDLPLLHQLHEHAIPCYNYSGALPATHFRHAPHLFHRMGFLKAELIVHVLQTGRHALVSDSDVVWIADPSHVIAEMHALGATLAASTDCLDVSADRDKTHRATSPVTCGYAPGNTMGAVFNTGVLWFASDAAAIRFARTWAAETLALTDPYSDDQGVFNRLMIRGLYPVIAHSADGRVIRGSDGLRIAALPAEQFCSGHLVWVQQAARTENCLSVHATFTEYGDAVQLNSSEPRLPISGACPLPPHIPWLMASWTDGRASDGGSSSLACGHSTSRLTTRRVAISPTCH